MVLQRNTAARPLSELQSSGGAWPSGLVAREVGLDHSLAYAPFPRPDSPNPASRSGSSPERVQLQLRSPTSDSTAAKRKVTPNTMMPTTTSRLHIGQTLSAKKPRQTNRRCRALAPRKKLALEQPQRLSRRKTAHSGAEIGKSASCGGVAVGSPQHSVDSAKQIDHRRPKKSAKPRRRVPEAVSIALQRFAEVQLVGSFSSGGVAERGKRKPT